MRSAARALAALLAALSLAFGLTAVAQDPKPDRKELEKLLAETDAIAEKVSKIRGLPIKKPITRGIMSKEEVTKRVLLRIDEEYAAVELDQEERAAKRLGLFPGDRDYKDVIIKLLTEQIAGFYDPAVKELYIADWVSVDTQRIVMAHEIDHALQDQSFDLVRFTKPIKDNGDEQLARQALVEGDGVALMIEFMFQEMGVPVDPWADDKIAEQMGSQVAAAGFAEFNRAPLFLQESLMFPYTAGLKLIAAARRHHAWTRVDEMYAKPPLSTEQVLHPDKYFTFEKPVVVKAAAALPSLKKWKVVYQSVLGELMWSVLLRQHGVRPQRAATAAEGWGGDRYAIYAPATDDGEQLGELILVCLSHWDAETDAIEAFEAAREALMTLAGAEQAREQKGEYVLFDERGGTVGFLERKGQKLLFVLGAPADKAAKLRAEAWAKWK